MKTLYGIGTKKMLNLMILNILQKYSDADHRLTQKRIIDLLDAEYGIICERRAVASNLDSLAEMGYNIVKTRGGTYIVPTFSHAELRTLIDSVIFSKTSPAAEINTLVDKIQSLGNKYFAANTSHIASLHSPSKINTASVHANLDILSDAISRNRKINFVYNVYGEDFQLHAKCDKPYVASPRRIIASNGRYYLTACTDYCVNYRVDKMTDIKILDETAEPLTARLNPPENAADQIYMFTGDSGNVRFWTYGYMLDALVDWFGRSFEIIQHDRDRILIGVRTNLQAMKYWSLQFGEHVEVVEPQFLRDEIRNTAENIRTAHEDAAWHAENKAASEIEIPAWMMNTEPADKPILPRIAVIGAGSFGAEVVDGLRARSADELEFIDEVEFISLSEDDLKRTRSSPIIVGGFKFTAWSFDSEIQKRLDEVDLIIIAADEDNLKSTVAFVAGSSKTKIFALPDSVHESSGGNIFVKFDAANFADSVYKMVRSFRDLLYHDGGAIFETVDAGVLRSSADEIAIAFYDENATVSALSAISANATKVLCVATASRADNFNGKIVQAAFPSAAVYRTAIVDDSMEADAVRVMIVTVNNNAG